jgi:hypothetical protein
MVEKSIKRERVFTITKQHISILYPRLEVKVELMSLLQKIKALGQALLDP